jgi:hypothetical protein
MTTGLTYSTYVSQIATLAIVSPTDPAFVAILPQMITYAENRIYRDLDLLGTVSSITYTVTAGNRFVSISQDDFVTLQDINVITPAGTTNPELGTRNSLLPVTKEYLNVVWPSGSGASIPVNFAVFNQSSIIVGPWPDANYTIEAVGTVRPQSLSNSNSTTIVSDLFPDLFIMASMIYVTGYQRNFGKVADEPEMAGSYETQYQNLLKSATVEENRKKFWSGAWTSMSPAVVATPSR